MLLRSLYVLLLLVCTSVAQTNSGLGSLAKAKTWPVGSWRIYPLPMPLFITKLTTSWIPGENRMGMMRYRITMRLVADPREFEAYTSTTLERVDSQCSITLRMVDADSFIVRKTPITWDHGVNDAGSTTSLVANSYVQMDASEYRSVLKGGYLLSWACNDSM